MRCAGVAIYLLREMNRPFCLTNQAAHSPHRHHAFRLKNSCSEAKARVTNNQAQHLCPVPRRELRLGPPSGPHPSPSTRPSTPPPPPENIAFTTTLCVEPALSPQINRTYPYIWVRGYFGGGVGGQVNLFKWLSTNFTPTNDSSEPKVHGLPEVILPQKNTHVAAVVQNTSKTKNPTTVSYKPEHWLTPS